MPTNSSVQYEADELAKITTQKEAHRRLPFLLSGSISCAFIFLVVPVMREVAAYLLGWMRSLAGCRWVFLRKDARDVSRKHLKMLYTCVEFFVSLLLKLMFSHG
ncbi:hypothetical protein [Herbaspirillum sp.]|uniref:hypothetical protein n=1 Tax=Herbaspirillum sp. TaxID=1890675 RepID=UPI0031DF741E